MKNKVPAAGNKIIPGGRKVLFDINELLAEKKKVIYGRNNPLYCKKKPIHGINKVMDVINNPDFSQSGQLALPEMTHSIDENI